MTVSVPTAVLDALAARLASDRESTVADVVLAGLAKLTVPDRHRDGAGPFAPAPKRRRRHAHGSRPLGVYLTEEQARALLSLSDRSGQSYSALITEALAVSLRGQP